MPFEKLTLNDGNAIPAIGLGSGSVNKDHDMTELVLQAIETGFSHIDTAQAYQNEDSVGKGIRESGLSREELFVTTKYRRGPIQEAARQSLDKVCCRCEAGQNLAQTDDEEQLGLKYVDLYLVHRPELVEHDYEGCWREFETIHQEGLAKSIGVSNFTIEQLQVILKIARVKPVVNQGLAKLLSKIEFHPYTYAQHKPLLEFCAEHRIIIEAYSSLAWKTRPITKFPGGPVDAPIAAAAKRLGITPNQVIFLWVKAKGAVIVTTSSKKERLENYLAVGDLSPLTNEEIAAIDEAGARQEM
ncbi:hypothetical protein DXG01_003451 [Tephrocybe rancida]|nr:hypothetical protein DXG01_003451 [Tephrocybe rancida]